MTVRELQDGAAGGWISADAFRVDREGAVCVDLDALVHDEADPEEDLLRIRRNRDISADESGLKVGQNSLVEVPAEELAGRKLALLEDAGEKRWAKVTLWKPWSYSWKLKSLPAAR